MQQRTNKKLITLSERQLDMIDALMAETGWSKPTQVILRGIEELYKTTFRYGKDPVGGTVLPQDSDEVITKKAESKAKLEVAKKLAAENLRLKPKIDRCINTLKGEIITNPDGSRLCKYKTHDTSGSYDQSIPINQCGDYLEAGQFMPDKATVLKHRPDLK